MRVTAALIRKFLPHDTNGLAECLVEHGELMQSFGIVTGRHLNFMLSNYYEETGGGAKLVENLNYSAAALRRTFPARVRLRREAAKNNPEGNPKAVAEAIEHNPRAIANAVYGGRYGNRWGTDDGYMYRGRGLTMLTFHDNYAEARTFILQTCGVDIVAKPDAVATAKVAVLTALFYWQRKNLNRYVSRNDIEGARRAINGGDNGLESVEARVAHGRTFLPDATPLEWTGTTDDRVARLDVSARVDDQATPALDRSKVALDAVQQALDAHRAETAYTGLQDAPPMPDVSQGPALSPVVPKPQVGAPGVDFAAIRDGVFNETVQSVQRQLWARNFKMVGLRDGKMGRNTRAAIAAFREEAGLPPTTGIDADLLVALAASKPAEIAPERAQASAKDIRSRVATVRQAWKAKILAVFTGGAAVVNQGVSYLTQPDNLETVRGTANAAKGWASDLGLGVWAVSTVAVLAGAGAVWWYSHKSEASGTEGFRAGEITGQ